jgi:putative N6-adenine-specific DNA methylase
MYDDLKVLQQTWIMLVVIALHLIDCTESLVVSSPVTNKQFFATTVQGLEPVLAYEIKQLQDARNIEIGKCGVSFHGSYITVLEGLMKLRTSLKLMEVISEENNIRNRDDVYDMCYKYDWATMLTPSSTLKCEAILGNVPNDLSHSHFTALCIKNAIVDQFRDRYGERPSVDIEDPDLNLSMYIHKQKATLYRVWSGTDSMHKRGYRDIIHRAALRETTAAAL